MRLKYELNNRCKSVLDVGVNDEAINEATTGKR